MKISILCPTRNRVEFVKDFLKSCHETAKNPSNIEFVFYVDEDDRMSNIFFDNYESEFDFDIVYVVGERIVLSEMWNECYSHSSGEIYMHAGDDIRFRTKDWDEMIINKFKEFDDRIAFVYGRDGYQPKTFGTHGFLHKNWIKAVGYFVPPYFVSDFNDSWLNEVAKLAGRHFFVDVYTEHLHPIINKHFWDQTHKERKIRHRQQNPRQLYDQKLPERKGDAEKLKEFIKNFKLEK